MAGWFVPIVDITHDDQDTTCHMSDIPLQLAAIAHVASHKSASVTFSQAESDPTQNAHSLHSKPTQTRIIPSQSQCPLTCPPCVYLTSTNVSISHTTSTSSSECSARNGSMCCASSTRRISRCHSSIRGGCEAIFCQCFGKK